MMARKRHIHSAAELTAAVDAAAFSLSACVWVRLQKPWRGAPSLCCFSRQGALCWGEAFTSISHPPPTHPPTSLSREGYVGAKTMSLIVEANVYCDAHMQTLTLTHTHLHTYTLTHTHRVGEYIVLKDKINVTVIRCSQNFGSYKYIRIYSFQ